MFVQPLHQDIPHHKQGQNRQLYAEEVKGLQRPLFVPPPGGEVEQVYYDNPLHTPVYIEVRDYSCVWYRIDGYSVFRLWFSGYSKTLGWRSTSRLCSKQRNYKCFY